MTMERMVACLMHPKPEVWPSPLGVQRIVSQFRSLPEMDQSKKMVNQETFLRQRIVKANEQLKKLRKENREKEMSRVMFQSLTGKPLQGLTMIDLNDLGWLIDQNLKELVDKIKTRKEELAQRNPVPVPPTPAAVPAAGDHALNLNMHATMERQAFGLSNMGNTMQRPSWFTDMMNPNEQMGFGAVAEVLPFGDQYHHGHGLKTTGGCDDDEAVMRWRKKKKSVSACLASLLISLITGLNQAQRPLDLSDVRDSGRERDRERGRAVGVLIEFPSWYFRDNRADNVL